MKLTGKELIDAFVKKHPQSKPCFDRWASSVRAASWRHPMEVKQTFNHADFIGDNRIIFDIGGNKFRLMAVAIYINGELRVRWVGTHAEYDKLTF